MGKAPDTALGKMYEEHIDLILKKDVEALLNQYTDDAVLISSFEKVPRYFRGREELREHFKGILGINGLEVDIAFWAETEDPTTLMIVEAIKLQTDAGEASMRFADSWVLRDGKIAIHFAGMVQHADGSLAFLLVTNRLKSRLLISGRNLTLGYGYKSCVGNHNGSGDWWCAHYKFTPGSIGRTFRNKFFRNNDSSTRDIKHAQRTR